MRRWTVIAAAFLIVLAAAAIYLAPGGDGEPGRPAPHAIDQSVDAD